MIFYNFRHHVEMRAPLPTALPSSSSLLSLPTLSFFRLLYRVHDVTWQAVMVLHSTSHSPLHECAFLESVTAWDSPV